MNTFARNPVLWIVCLLPASAVVAGLTTLGIALREADRPLPQAYHWEGVNLDRDFATARAAAARHIAVEFGARNGECTAVVSGEAGDAPALTLMLTNSNDPDLDLTLRLVRTAAGDYRSACAAIPQGHWRIAIQDEAATWSLRAELDGGMARQILRARSPEGAGA